MNKDIVGVELADGTMLNASAGYANGDLWIWMADAEDSDNDMLRLVTIFTDPEKTARIICHTPGGVRQEWEGFTKLDAATTSDGKINLRMRKPG